MRDALGGRETDAQPGEGARTGPDDDCRQARTVGPGPPQQVVDGGQEGLPVAIAGRPVDGVDERTAGRSEGDDDPCRRAVDGEQGRLVHPAASR